MEDQQLLSPTANHGHGFNTYILTCGDVHPLPGPSVQHATGVQQRVYYSAGYLKQLRNSMRSNKTFTSDPVFIDKLNRLTSYQEAPGSWLQLPNLISDSLLQ